MNVEAWAQVPGLLTGEHGIFTLLTKAGDTIQLAVDPTIDQLNLMAPVNAFAVAINKPVDQIITLF